MEAFYMIVYIIKYITLFFLGTHIAFSAVNSYPYKKKDIILNELSTNGSSTLAPITTQWILDFIDYYPEIDPTILSQNSSFGIQQLINQEIGIARSSNRITPQKKREFFDKYGYYPTEIVIALDALIIIVNRKNTIQSISLQELSNIFSMNNLCGGEKITSWSHFNTSTHSEDARINIFSREFSSGTASSFKRIALCQDDYSNNVVILPDNYEITDQIAQDINAISFIPRVFLTKSTKIVPINITIDDQIISPTITNIQTGLYPLVRQLYFYVNKAPNKPLDPTIKEFILYVLSQQGQEQLKDYDLLPISETMIKLQKEKIEQ